MGVDLGDLVAKRRITLENLYAKTIALDAYNIIYQFLSNIRSSDGNLLMDRKGRVTSHLSGLFYRNLRLLQNGIRLVYVFDGKPSILKLKTLEARAKRREEALAEWEKAKEAGNLEEMRKYAKQSAKINEDIIADSKKLLELMGIPYVVAPTEGEAQAAYLAKKNLVYAAGSQDYDTIVFGSPRLIRNITIVGKRKLPNKSVYIDIYPEEILLNETLEQLGIDQEKLIWVSLLIGNDYVDGIKGIGPKTAVKLVKESGSFKELVQKLKEKGKTFENEEDAEKAYLIFKYPEVEDVGPEDLAQKPVNTDGIIKFLHDEHDFDLDKITNALKEYEKNKRRQSALF